MVGVDGTNPSPCLLLQGAAILGLNHPESLAPTTAGLSTHESEPDPARASTAAASHRGGSAAASEGCYEAEASDRATAADTRASALRGLAHADVCCASTQGGVMADAPPPAGSGCAIAITDVWVRACTPLHDEMMLHLFAGTPRLGSFADAAESLSMRVDQIDLLHGGSDDDMAVAEARERVLASVRAGKYSIVWIGTPCSSFSLWWLDASMRQLRSRERPAGLPSLPRRERAYLRKHNALVEFSAQVALAAFEVGATFVIENPPDRGQLGSPLFRWAARRHAPLWLMPCMRSLAVKTRAVMLTFPQCALGGDFQKWTSLLVAGPRASQLQALGELTCTHGGKHARVAEGRDTQGRSNAAASAAYPIGMAAFVMWALARPAVRHACAFGVPVTVPQRVGGIPARPPSDVAPFVGAALDGVRRYVRAQQQLNAQAAAVFAGETQCSDCEEQMAVQRPDWRAVPTAIPAHWDECSHVTGEQWALRRDEQLRFISRRRAEPESAEVLATRPMPTPHVVPDLPALDVQQAAQWPRGAPRRPIHISQLYNVGVYADIRKEICEAADEVAEAELSLRCGGVQYCMRRRSERVWRAVECQPAWARLVAWDCTDVDDCVPLRSYTMEEPVTHSLSREFFAQWGARLRWSDKDMLQQISITGAEGRSQCEMDTVIMFHHTGLREHYKPARESVRKDTERGWIRQGRRDLVTVPARLVPKNVVARQQWKLVMDELRSVVKWRVTTDDSMEVATGGIQSRNGGMVRDDWAETKFPAPQTLAEAVAQVRSVAQTMGVKASAIVFERIALWALDLSDAYREIEVNRSEWWQQGFIWYDGVRLDMRCVFGSAHMPGFFQRVSTFVLAVAVHRVKEYDRQHPYSAARQAWSKWRRDNVDGEDGDCDFASIYLDDGSGLTVLGAGEPLVGAPDVLNRPVASSVTVDPSGRVRLALFGDKSRGQVHLQIFQHTFMEAGWKISIEKIQYDFTLDLLGLGITSEGDGAMFVQEAKRRGMIQEVTDIENPRAACGSVLRADFERLVGRASNMGQIVCEANPYLQPMYRLQNAKQKRVDRRSGRMVKFKPGRITTRGGGPTQARCHESLSWFKAALQSGASVPLAPRRSFPDVGEDGCAFLFTDAAREAGTGHGGFSIVQRDGAPKAEFLFAEQRWPPDVLVALQENEMSMAAGEGYGAVVMADAVLTELETATHMVVFTDSSATEAAINSGNSPSPQMNFLVRWLVERWSNVQFLAVWVPGIHNEAADGISRVALDSVLADAEAADLAVRRLPACDGAHALMRAVWAEPQAAAGN